MHFSTSSRSRRRAVLAAAIALANIPHFTRATTKTWADTNGNWSLGTNWSGGIKPGTGDFAVLSKTGNLICTYDVTSAPFSVGSILIDGNMTLAQSVATSQLNPGSIIVGSAGAGSYSLSSSTGTLGVTNQIILGQGAGSVGSVLLSAGSLSASTINVGSLGGGNFIQTGGTTTIANMSIGTSVGSGFYQLNGGALNASGTVTLGTNGSFTSNGSGSLSSTTTFDLAGGAASGTINSNGTFISDSGTLAGGGAGTMLISRGAFIYNGGDNSAWQLKNLGFVTINNNWAVNSIVNQSAQSFTIPSGITVNLTTTNNVDNRALSNDGTIVLNGGTLNVTASTSSEVIGDGGAGRFSHLAGSNSTPNLFIGNGTTSSGIYDLESGTLNVTTYEAIGYLGSGVLIQSTATHSTPSLQLGVQSSGHGFLSIGGGALNVTGLNLSMIVGLNGVGSINQTGGVITANTMSIAEDAGSSGSYFLQAGTLNCTTEIIADDNASASFQQIGGANTTTTLSMADFSANARGTYQLTSGTLNAVNEYIATAGAGTFTQLGGVHTITTLLDVSTSTTSVGTFDLAGGTLTVPEIVLNANSQFIQTGGVLNVGTINTNGFVSRYSFQNGVLFLNNSLNVSDTGLLGANVSISPTRSIFVQNALILNGFTNTTVDGGTLQVGSIVNLGGHLTVNSGTLNVTNASIDIGASSPLGTSVVLGPGANILEGLAGGGAPFTIDSNALLDLSGGAVTSALGFNNNGQIIMDSPVSSITGGSSTNFGLLRGSGRINSGLNNQGGEVRADSDDDLQFTGTGNSNNSGGRFTLNGGRIEFANDLTNAVTGTITGRGSLIANGGFINNGSVVFSGAGNTDVTGTVTNNSRINITGANTTTFWSNVNTSTGTISVNNNSTVVFAGNLTGQSHVTGPGVKDYEGTASGGPIASIVGDTIIESTANVSADFLHENDVQVYGTLQVPPTSPQVSQINTLSSVAGTFDLTNNHLIVTSTPLVSIAADITSAYNGGNWDGPGLTSSTAAAAALGVHKTALGYATAASLGLNTFDGVSVSPSSVLVRYTYSGDANLDGVVNALDFNALATNFGSNPGSVVWYQGDFNYDGVVNTTDFTLMATNFSLIQPSSPVLGSLVPEPMTVALPLLVAMLTRRRRFSIG